jgi:flagellar biosynthesis GTPase FlhF
MAVELNIALVRTALIHFIDHSGAVEKGSDLYAFVDDLRYALDKYFEEHGVALQIAEAHELHKALELQGYSLMYSGVTSSYVNDPDKTGLVVRGFSVTVPEESSEEEEEEEEDDEEEEEEDDEEEEEEEEEEDGDEEEEEAEEEELDEDEVVLQELVEQAKAEEARQRRKRHRRHARR